MPEHVRALSSAVSSADRVIALLTHGHVDHAGGARAFAAEVGAEVWGPRGLPGLDRELRDGDVVETDEGTLECVDTPGHARPHFCYLLRETSALFAGDLLIGAGDTTWVGEYPGCVADYLASLQRLRSLDLAVIYPAHGDPLMDATEAIDRFEAHRRERIAQVRRLLSERPGAELDELFDIVYGGGIPSAVRRAARLSVGALLEHVREGAA